MTPHSLDRKLRNTLLPLCGARTAVAVGLSLCSLGLVYSTVRATVPASARGGSSDRAPPTGASSLGLSRSPCLHPPPSTLCAPRPARRPARDSLGALAAPCFSTVPPFSVAHAARSCSLRVQCAWLRTRRSAIPSAPSASQTAWDKSTRRQAHEKLGSERGGCARLWKFDLHPRPCLPPPCRCFPIISSGNAPTHGSIGPQNDHQILEGDLFLIARCEPNGFGEYTACSSRCAG